MKPKRPRTPDLDKLRHFQTLVNAGWSDADIMSTLKMSRRTLFYRKAELRRIREQAEVQASSHPTR